MSSAPVAAPPVVAGVAGLWDRTRAIILDFIVVSILQGFINDFYGTLHVTNGVIDPMVTGGVSTYTTTVTVDSFWLLVIWLGYFTLLEGLFGATAGKAFVGLRVASLDGRRAGWPQVIVRNLLRPIDAFPSVYLVGALLARFSPLHQRLGDRVAGTVVIAARDLADPPLSPAERRRRTGLLAALLVVLTVASLAYTYFGRAAYGADTAMRFGEFGAPTIEPVARYHLGPERRSAATVTYSVTFTLARTQRTCQGELILNWEGFLAGWQMSGMQYTCSP